MQFLTDTKIDFMRLRKVLGALSLLLAITSLVVLVSVKKLNIGIDFTGGTQVTLRFQEQPPLDELRDVLVDAGFPEATLQRFGAPEDNEVLIRTATVEGSEEGSSDALLEALDGRFNVAPESSFDLNRKAADDIAALLTELDPDGVVVEAEVPALETAEPDPHYLQAAEQILELRRQDGLIQSWDQVTGLPGVSEAVTSALESNTHLGEYALLSVENVGPQIGSELQSKGVWAVILSLAGMLGYIAFRFEWRFGVGAVVAIVHDVVISLGLYAFVGYEFNLTTIAAFLTLVGYSVNDTVVVFDRVRENMQRMRRESLYKVLNLSLNQTLTRTIMTSGTTFLVVSTLYFFGGDVIRGFAFILMIGIIIGTYSSVFVASPVVLAWDHFVGQAKARRAVAPR
ncbi:MAG: protein translocase subunit SecF [Acidobacteriota bacterium]|nr:protein translocase subunit SecF [Acidobacteriota bacterium]